MVVVAAVMAVVNEWGWMRRVEKTEEEGGWGYVEEGVDEDKNGHHRGLQNRKHGAVFLSLPMHALH